MWQSKMTSAVKAQIAEPPPSELELQRRWAEGRWPVPWLRPAVGGPPLRVHFAGRWNRGPGPDFRGAILLDAHGRARRGDVELHCRPAGWRSHGHHRDPAYARVLLHVVGASGGAAAGPPLALLPPPNPNQPAARAAPTPPPCSRVVEHVGPAAVAARLRRIAHARLERKAALLRRRRAELRTLSDSDDRFVAWSLARALAMPHNTERLAVALDTAFSAADPSAEPSGEAWPERLRGRLLESLASQPGWRPGRGALGRPTGAADALIALLVRWGRGRAAASCRELAALEPSAAVERLRLPQRLGPTRARQLLADAIYPAALALGEPPASIERRWRNLPERRYLRTAALRERLTKPAAPAGAPRFRHGEAQALLELEQVWCAQAACAVCPLGRLAREAPRPAALIPSLNIPLHST